MERFVKLDAAGAALPANAQQWTGVLDTASGLVWSAYTIGSGMDYQQAGLAAQALDLCGAPARLPTLMELFGLVDSERTSPAIVRRFFHYTKSEAYWTCTDCVAEEHTARRVHCGDFEISGGLSDDEACVLAMRSAAPVPHAPQRFVKLDAAAAELPADAREWSGVLDTASGLIWSAASVGKDMTLTQARQIVAALSLCGAPARLPTLDELTGLLEHRHVPAADPFYFPQVEPDWHWTAPTRVVSGSAAWLVDFCYGEIEWGQRDDTCAVRAVRGPAPAAAAGADRFVKLSADGAQLPATATDWTGVLDTTTGLIWSAATVGRNLTCSQAEALAGSLNLCGRPARLPSLQELVGLADRSRTSPALDDAFFPATEWETYWTTTRHAELDHTRWVVEFKNGETYYQWDQAPGTACVRAVA